MQEIFEKIIEKLKEHIDHSSGIYNSGYNEGIADAIEIVEQAVAECNNGWIPCEEELPPQPEENTVFDNKHLELYLVSIRGEKYPFRAFWNGKFLLMDGVRYMRMHGSHYHQNVGRRESEKHE